MAALLGLRGRVRREHYETVSADAPLYQDSAATVGDTIADDGLPDPDEELLREDVRREVRAAVDRLQEDQALAVRGYYLDGIQQNVLAAQMGVSSERVRQIKRKGWNKLRMDRRLRRLADDVLGAPNQHVGVAAFHRDWTSTVERAVIDREWLRKQAVRLGMSEDGMRRIGL